MTSKKWLVAFLLLVAIVGFEAIPVAIDEAPEETEEVLTEDEANFGDNDFDEMEDYDEDEEDDSDNPNELMVDLEDYEDEPDNDIEELKNTDQEDPRRPWRPWPRNRRIPPRRRFAARRRPWPSNRRKPVPRRFAARRPWPSNRRKPVPRRLQHGARGQATAVNLSRDDLHADRGDVADVRVPHENRQQNMERRA
ncbi:hypothetical protein OS493_019180 [Desmophyllum pertusum]|uniref:Uncharacterized protein n=1 Tax=Desmophyllum pertusum TaxID=174260 RepID=A0A9W9YET3_9CNID|nr:hypothetical protein OS493_019180 [Desmophyllum pertusum]